VRDKGKNNDRRAFPGEGELDKRILNGRNLVKRRGWGKDNQVQAVMEHHLEMGLKEKVCT
jgi:hypothetical protein